MVGIGEAQLGPAAAEEPPEHIVEILLDLVVGLQEELGALVADLVGDLLQVVARLLEVGHLPGQELVAFFDFLVFLGSHQVDRSQILELAAKLGERVAQLGHGGAELEHALLELGEVARIQFQEILPDILDLGLALRDRKMDGLQLRLDRLHTVGQTLRILLALHEIGVLEGDPLLHRIHLGGELLALGLELGQAGIDLVQLLVEFVAPARFGEDLRLLLAEAGFLPGDLAAEDRQRVLGARHLRLELGLAEASLLERMAVGVDLGREGAVFGAQGLDRRAVAADAVRAGRDGGVDGALLRDNAFRREEFVEEGGIRLLVGRELFGEFAEAGRYAREIVGGLERGVDEVRGALPLVGEGPAHIVQECFLAVQARPDAVDEGLNLGLELCALRGGIAGLLEPRVELLDDRFRDVAQGDARRGHLVLDRPDRDAAARGLLVVAPQGEARRLDARLELLDMALGLPESDLEVGELGFLVVLLFLEGGDLVADALGAQFELLDLGGDLADAVDHEGLVLLDAVLFNRQPVERLLHLDELGLHVVDEVQALGHRGGKGFGLGLDLVALPALLRELGVALVLVADELPEPQQVDVALNLEDAVLEFAEGDRFLGLVLEAVVRALDLGEHGLDLFHVLFGALELGFGFLDPHLVLGDARGFLEEVAPVLGLRGEDLVDLALFHHRVG